MIFATIACYAMGALSEFVHIICWGRVGVRVGLGLGLRAPTSRFGVNVRRVPVSQQKIVSMLCNK